MNTQTENVIRMCHDVFTYSKISQAVLEISIKSVFPLIFQPVHILYTNIESYAYYYAVKLSFFINNEYDLFLVFKPRKIQRIKLS